jgi:carbon monoxide dehydrogenase subunit G
MPEVQREFVVDAPSNVAWNYLTDMENFSSHVPGFEEYEKVGETTSNWTIKVDLSMFSRVMTFQVDVAEEEYPYGAFELDPKDQPAEGSGSVELEELTDERTQVTFTISSEASGRMAPFLNKVMEKALPTIADSFIASIEETDIAEQQRA